MQRLVICLTALVLCGMCHAVVINDGQVTNIDSGILDDIIIQNSFWNKVTTVNIKDGARVNDVKAWEDSVLNVSGGHVHGSIYGNDNSMVNISGGGIHSMFLNDQSSAVITRGSFSHWIEVGSIRGGGKLHVAGGGVSGDILASAGSEVLVTGGRIGGILGITDTTAKVTIEGLNLMLDGVAVSGTVVNPRNIVNSGHLTGTYLDGTKIDIMLQMDPHTSVSFIPEPATLILMAAGGMLIRRKRAA